MPLWREQARGPSREANSCSLVNVQRWSGADHGTAKATPGRPWSAVSLPDPRGYGGRVTCAWFGPEQERPVCLACVTVRYGRLRSHVKKIIAKSYAGNLHVMD